MDCDFQVRGDSWRTWTDFTISNNVKPLWYTRGSSSYCIGAQVWFCPWFQLVTWFFLATASPCSRGSHFDLATASSLQIKLVFFNAVSLAPEPFSGNSVGPIAVFSSVRRLTVLLPFHIRCQLPLLFFCSHKLFNCRTSDHFLVTCPVWPKGSACW